MDKALKKLRIKFVAVIMAVVAVILAVVFTVIVSINYTTSIEEASLALEEAVDHARFDQEAASLDKGPREEELALSKGSPRFEIGGRAPERSLVPVAVYEITENGSLVLVSSAASGAIADSAVDIAGQEAAKLADGEGFLDLLGVYYLKRSQGDTSIIAFADEHSVSGWKSLAFLLACVGIGALILFFGISLIFSRWALRPIASSWEKQQRFIADASHELKTPLSVISADVAILKRHPQQRLASQSQWIESIESEATNMQELVSDMLLLARADEQGLASSEESEPIDMSKMIQGLVLQFESLAFERSIELTARIDSDMIVVGYRSQLQRLSNVLFDNAFKYTNDGGRIVVGLSARNDEAVLSVNNTGSAIPAEDLAHVFDRFYRSDRARTRGGEQSFGLGLSIAYEIAQHHDGSIEVESSEAKGTTFTVRLPLSPQP